MSKQAVPLRAPCGKALESIPNADASEGRSSSLTRWHLACALIQTACLWLDRAANSSVLAFGLVIRLGLVVPVYLLGAYLLSRGPRSLRMMAVLAPMVVATGAVAFLGVLAPPPFNDRYTMAAGMIPLLGVILMPVTFREAALLTCVAIPLYVMTALGGWAGHPEQVADLVVFMSGLVILGLKVRYRLALVEKANVQLHLREHDRAEELAKLAHRLEVLSVTDPLTGIANRRGFDLAAERACRQCLEAGTWLGLLMIDVDYFKSFNDAAGHMAGDQCLRALVAVLTSSCPLEQGHLARFGGEEFVVLLPNLSPDQLKVQAERLRCAVAAAAIPHPGRGGASVTVSVGAAASKPIPLCTNIDELIAAADAALYAAKSRGRNCTMLGQVMSPDAGHRRTDVVTAAA